MPIITQCQSQRKMIWRPWYRKRYLCRIFTHGTVTKVPDTRTASLSASIIASRLMSDANVMLSSSPVVCHDCMNRLSTRMATHNQKSV